MVFGHAHIEVSF